MSTSPVPWKTAVSPIWTWVLRNAPGWLFKKFYTLRNFEKHILISLSQEEPPTFFSGGNFRPPELLVCFEIRNVSPYLDAHITRVSVDLYSADYSGNQGGHFADCNDWEHWELKRGELHYHHVNVWPNMYQAATLRTVVESMARLWGRGAVRVSTDIGEVFVPFEFDLNRKVQEVSVQVEGARGRAVGQP